jgi:hypothetical protein
MSQQQQQQLGGSAAGGAAGTPFRAAAPGPDGTLPMLWVPVAILAHAIAFAFLVKFLVLLHPGLPAQAAERLQGLLAWARAAGRGGGGGRTGPASARVAPDGGPPPPAAVEMGKQAPPLPASGAAAGGARLAVRRLAGRCCWLPPLACRLPP